MADPEISLDEVIDGLDGRTVTVIGATGLIGSTLVERLMAARSRGVGVGLVVTYRDRAGLESRFPGIGGTDGIELLRHDARDPMPDIRTDYIVHSASPAHPRAFVEDPVGVIDSNVMGIRSCLEYVRAHPGTRLLYVSSSEVYGRKTSDRPYAEGDLGLVDPLDPRSCYPEGKRAAETYARCYLAQYGCETVIVRPGHVYGPAIVGTSTRVDAQFMDDAVHGRDILMKSEGAQRRSYIHVDDVVSGMLYAMVLGTPGEAYNISNRDSDVTIRGFAEVLAGIAGVGIDMRVDPAACRGTSPVLDATLDPSRLESLGWRPAIGIEEGLRDTYLSLRERARWTARRRGGSSPPARPPSTSSGPPSTSTRR